MDIKETKNSRLFFEQLGDTEKVGKKKDKAKGFNRHSWLPGAIRSLFGLSFNDPENGYINKKSVVHYLKRNVDEINLTDEVEKEIQNLKEDTNVEIVQALFNKIKNIEVKNIVSKTVDANNNIAAKNIESPLDLLLRDDAINYKQWDDRYSAAFDDIAKMTDINIKQLSMNNLVDYLSVTIEKPKDTLTPAQVSIPTTAVYRALSIQDLNTEMLIKLTEAMLKANYLAHSFELSEKIGIRDLKKNLQGKIQEKVYTELNELYSNNKEHWNSLIKICDEDKKNEFIEMFVLRYIEQKKFFLAQELLKDYCKNYVLIEAMARKIYEAKENH
jgi:hypothetical protein